MSEQGWEGMGTLSIEGAAKYGHIRRDLRVKPEVTPEADTVVEKISWLREFARGALRTVGIYPPANESPENQ